MGRAERRRGWFGVGVVWVLLLGCTSAPVPTTGGFSLRPRVTVPSNAGTALSGGTVSLDLLENLFGPIGRLAPLTLRYEWERAPGMLMVALPQGTVDQASPWVSQLNYNIPDAEDRLSPVERDFAVCARQEVSHEYRAIPTSPSYAPLSIPLAGC